MNALVWHSVAGRSMWPLGPPLQAGVRHVPPQKLVRGDVIAFIAGSRPGLWVHRVVEIEANGVITRGDTNGFNDVPVPFGAVLGRVEALRLGAILVPLAQTGTLARLRRGLGLTWSQVAPALLRSYRRRKTGGQARNDP